MTKPQLATPVKTDQLKTAQPHNQYEKPQTLPKHGKTRSKAVTLAVIFVILILVVVTISAMLGQFHIPANEVFAAFARKIGWQPTAPAGTLAARADATLWNVRFPRIALGIIVGAALGVAGALSQSLFANPLAEPSVVGISAGASVGAALSIVFAINWFGIFTTPIFAFVFGLLTTLLVWSISAIAPAARALTMLLVGIAVNAIAGALTAFLFVVAPSTARDAVVFWQLGSFNGATWHSVLISLLVAAIAIIFTFPLAHKLDIMALGDRAAGHLGINIKRLQVVSVVLIAVLTAAAVSFVGMIGFVGLIVPHFVRITVGPAHRHLLPLSLLGGALLIAGGDLFARNAVQYADLPIGMVTALIGGPTFLAMLRSTLRGRNRK